MVLGKRAARHSAMGRRVDVLGAMKKREEPKGTTAGLGLIVSSMPAGLSGRMHYQSGLPEDSDRAAKIIATRFV